MIWMIRDRALNHDGRRERRPLGDELVIGFASIDPVLGVDDPVVVTPELTACVRRAMFEQVGALVLGTSLQPGTQARRVQKHKRTQGRRVEAVSIVINPWRAPDLGVGGDVGDSSSPSC